MAANDITDDVAVKIRERAATRWREAA